MDRPELKPDPTHEHEDGLLDCGWIDMPLANFQQSLAHWGNTLISGRGLLALTGRGQIHQISLKAGDEYVIHPSNLIAYSVMQHAPLSYRFKSSSLRLQIPNPFGWLPNTRFWQAIRGTPAWKYTRDAVFTVRTWARRTIWGDRVSHHLCYFGVNKN